MLSALRMVGQAVSTEIVGQAVLAALAANAVGRLALAIAAGPIAYSMPLVAATTLAARLRLRGVYAGSAVPASPCGQRCGAPDGHLGLGVINRR